MSASLAFPIQIQDKPSKKGKSDRDYQDYIQDELKRIRNENKGTDQPETSEQELQKQAILNSMVVPTTDNREETYQYKQLFLS